MKNEKNTWALKIVCDQISLSYRERMVLTSQNFNMEPHEKILIQGPSWSWKTSFLHMIAGLMHPTTGSVWYIDGSRSISTDTPSFYDFRQRNINITFADPIFFPTLSVEQNILFPHIFTGAVYENEWEIELIDTLGIRNILWSKMDHLSSGEKDRVNIVRALLYDRPILLLDEPWAHMDSILFEKFLSLLFRYFERVRPTTIIVSHSSRFEGVVDRRYICENTILSLF
jgi:ABC-type lipoprotein export system ATPase subunit